MKGGRGVACFFFLPRQQSTGPPLSLSLFSLSLSPSPATTVEEMTDAEKESSWSADIGRASLYRLCVCACARGCVKKRGRSVSTAARAPTGRPHPPCTSLSALYRPSRTAPAHAPGGAGPPTRLTPPLPHRRTGPGGG